MLNSYRCSGSKNRIILRPIAILASCVAAAIVTNTLAVAVSQQGRREIVSDDFTKPRPKPTPNPKPVDTTGGIGRIIAPKRPSMPAPIPEKHYRFSGSSAANAAPFTTGDNIQQLGMTLWRLRPVTGIDRGQRLLIRENGKSSEWLPERIEMNTPLRVGERVRLTIESPHEGYLYVIERDLFAGGKLGDVKLIFPTRSLPGDENQVRPGKLIDLPGQADNPNYFTTSLSRSDQVGEIFTIIITDTPLDSIIGNQRQLISAVDLAKWEREWGSESERFELEGGAGMVWTKEEKEASAGPASRQLTTDDPTPQTIYRIAATNKTAFLINVRLGYAR